MPPHRNGDHSISMMTSLRCGHGSALLLITCCVPDAQVFLVNITHPSNMVEPADVDRILGLLCDVIHLSVVFDPERQGLAGSGGVSPDGGTAASAAGRASRPSKKPTATTPPPKRHLLRGFVCYTSMHYVAFFWNPFEKSWSYCDDATVREVCVMDASLR